MRVLILGSDAARSLVPIVQKRDRVTFSPDLPADFAAHDMLVSFGLRRILTPIELAPFGDAAVNLHIALLPWNRGADPNFWSWFDGTPKGVSLHVMTRGLDTGPLLAQHECRFGRGETLRTSYDRLIVAGVSLFGDVWCDLRAGRIPPRRQVAGGSYHRAADKADYMRRLPLGFDTPVREVEALGLNLRYGCLAS